MVPMAMVSVPMLQQVDEDIDMSGNNFSECLLWSLLEVVEGHASVHMVAKYCCLHGDASYKECSG